MGAVTFSLDPALLDALARALPLEVFVETGTFHGDAVALAAPRFRRVVTIEQSRELWSQASQRFRGDSRIEVVHGDSADVLTRVAPALRGEATVYWLDAHWCVAEHTAGERSQCPLLGELAAIGTLGPSSVVLIDDARLFLATPPIPHDVTQWPSYDAIARALRGLSAAHEIMVVNDVIAFFPPGARDAMVTYARELGVDWLRARQSLEENEALRRQVEEKEDALRAKHDDVIRIDEALRDKDEALGAALGELDKRAAEIRILDAGLSAERERNAALEQDRAARLGDIAQRDERIAGLETEAHAGRGELDRAREQLEAQRVEIGERQREIEALRLDSAGRQQDIEAKQREIERKHADLTRAQADLVAKERVIRELHTALMRVQTAARLLTPVRTAWGPLRAAAARVHGWVGVPLRVPRPVAAASRAVAAAARDARRMLRPRLGVLYQHPPIPLGLPPPAAASRTELPTVSLVTPSFRQAGFIGRTIDSVLSQEYPKLEYFVQDGGSDDGTVETLRSYEGRIAGWDSRRDSGQSQAINRGFARTTGEVMGWLNSDDILLPGALRAVGEFFARHPDVDVVYGHRVLIDENDAEIGRWIMPPHDDAVLSWADFVPQETMFWRRRIWDRAGGRIDESFRFAMDWDLIVRFRAAGARFARLPRFLGGFRIHPHQKTSAAINEVGFQEMNRIRERMLGRVPSPIEVRRAVAPYLARHLVTDLAWRARRRLGASG